MFKKNDALTVFWTPSANGHGGYRKAYDKAVPLAISAVALAVSAPSVFAADATGGWDYTGLTSSIDFSTISVGVLAVAGILAGVYAGIKGAKIVLGFLRG